MISQVSVTTEQSGKECVDAFIGICGEWMITEKPIIDDIVEKVK